MSIPWKSQKNVFQNHLDKATKDELKHIKYYTESTKQMPNINQMPKINQMSNLALGPDIYQSQISSHCAAAAAGVYWDLHQQWSEVSTGTERHKHLNIKQTARPCICLNNFSVWMWYDCCIFRCVSLSLSSTSIQLEGGNLRAEQNVERRTAGGACGQLRGRHTFSPPVYVASHSLLWPAWLTTNGLNHCGYKYYIMHYLLSMCGCILGRWIVIAAKVDAGWSMLISQRLIHRRGKN